MFQAGCATLTTAPWRCTPRGHPTAVEALSDYLRRGPRGAAVEDVAIETVRVEGHEQFAIRGVSAGVFVVQQHAASTRHFDLRLELAGAMRSWAVPKGPSLDPSAKRLAVQVPDHGMEHNDFEGSTEHGGVIVWDRGRYEQGGRVAWPEALDRGHAVFVLHGEKLRGGFVLQRTRPGPPAAVAFAQAARRSGAPRVGHRFRATCIRPERSYAGGRAGRAGVASAG